MKRTMTIAGIVSIFAAGLLLFNAGIELNGADKLKIGDEAPEISIKIINTKEYGDSFTLKDAKGKVVVLEFWATWCPPCRQSIPHLSKLQGEYKDQAIFVGVSNEDKKTVEDFYKNQKDMKYRVAIDDNDKTSAIYMGGFNVRGIPHAFIISGGKITWHGHPMEMDDELKKIVSAQGKKTE